MIEILEQINEITSGSAMVVGGVAKWLNGYTETYDKKWIDVCVTPDVVTQIKSLGKAIEFKNGTTFPSPTINQFIVKIVPEGVHRRDGYVLDVFVEESIEGKYTTISGSNVITPEADIEWHTELSASLENDICHDKLMSRKALYGIE